MKKIIILLFFIPCLGYAQVVLDAKRDNIWSMGNTHAPTTRTLLDFSKPSIQLSSAYTPINTFLTNGSVCCPYGNLLFYTNGWSVCDSTNQVMPNGDSLSLGDAFNLLYSGWYGNVIPQGVLVLPKPDNPNQFIIFHEALDLNDLGVEPNPLVPGLMYSVVDMTLNNGKGDVLAKNQRLIKDTLYTGGLTAVRHANGRDWWILVPAFYKPGFFRILLNPNGMHVYTQSIPGLPYGENNEGGMSVFSPDGHKYIRVSNYSYQMPFRFEIYSFDRCSGLLSDYTNLEGWIPGNTAAMPFVSVSSNSRYLYVGTSYIINQYDLENPDIESTKIEVARWDSTYYLNLLATVFGYSQLAPDNKIYISSDANPYLHIIHNPDLPGLACDVQQRAITLYDVNDGGIPNFPNFRLGRLVGSPCDTLGIYWGEEELNSELVSITAYPNPADNFITFNLTISNHNRPLQLQIYDFLGRHINSISVAPLQGAIRYDVRSLPAGVYMGVLRNENTQIAKVKFIVE